MHLNKRNDRFWANLLPNLCKDEVPKTIKCELAKSRILNKQIKRASNVNLKHKITEFHEGDLVLLKTLPTSNAFLGETKGLCLIYEGPYKILNRIGKSTYFISDSHGHKPKGPYHTSSLKKFNS